MRNENVMKMKNDCFASYAFKRKLITFYRGNFLASKLGPPTFLVSSEALIANSLKYFRCCTSRVLLGESSDVMKFLFTSFIMSHVTCLKN